MAKRKRMKKKLPIWKNMYFMAALLLIGAMVVSYVGINGSPFTTVQNIIEDPTINADIIIESSGETYQWGSAVALPDDFEAAGLEGAIEIGVEVYDSNVDLLFITLFIEGPSMLEENLTETSEGVWSVSYDTSAFQDGDYTFRIVGEIDTSPLYRTEIEAAQYGEIISYDFTEFSVSWEGGTGYPSEIYGIPYEIAIGVGVVVVLILLFTGNSRRSNVPVMV